MSEMKLTKLKHIVVDENNYLALKALGEAGDSFNDVLTNILEKVIAKQNDSDLRAHNRANPKNQRREIS